MYKNNFDEVFERVYSSPEFARYIRKKRISTVVKWAAYIGILLLFIIIMLVSGNGFKDPRIVIFMLFWLFLAPMYWLIVSKLGRRTLSDAVFHSLLVSVLDGCFDEAVTSCESGLDRTEYEKSSPEGRYGNFNGALFQSSDLALTVKSDNAEITVCEVTVTDQKTNHCDGGFDNSYSVTEMIFAVAKFNNGRIPFNRGETTEKTYVSVYGSTLYIEIDGKSLSVGAATKKTVRENCREVCGCIEKILEIVGRA